ncbi:hypothetical protein BH683_006990 [Williamsia sp. 1138]|nr:hypothetical protein BH683_006990 [Williamsia sp. 1138]
MSYLPPGTPWNNGHIESFNFRLRKPQSVNQPDRGRVVIEDLEDDHKHRHRHSSLGYGTPAEYAAQCAHTQHPVECGIN